MQCALFLYSLIHSITRHFTERINCKLKRKRKLFRWDWRIECTLILYLWCNWVRVTVLYVLPWKLDLRFHPSPIMSACQRGAIVGLRKSALFPCGLPVVSYEGYCLCYSPLGHPGIWAKFRPKSMPSSQLPTQAFQKLDTNIFVTVSIVPSDFIPVFLSLSVVCAYMYRCVWIFFLGPQ